MEGEATCDVVWRTADRNISYFRLHQTLLPANPDPQDKRQSVCLESIRGEFKVTEISLAPISLDVCGEFRVGTLKGH